MKIIADPTTGKTPKLPGLTFEQLAHRRLLLLDTRQSKTDDITDEANNCKKPYDACRVLGLNELAQDFLRIRFVLENNVRLLADVNAILTEDGHREDLSDSCNHYMEIEDTE